MSYIDILARNHETKRVVLDYPLGLDDSLDVDHYLSERLGIAQLNLDRIPPGVLDSHLLALIAALYKRINFLENKS